MDLKTPRALLRDALDDAFPDIQVETGYEELAMDPPAILVLPASSWVSDDEIAFGEVRLSLDLWLIGGSSERLTSLTRIEDLAPQILAAIRSDGWDFTELTGPANTTLNGVEYRAARITVRKFIPLDA